MEQQILALQQGLELVRAENASLNTRLAEQAATGDLNKDLLKTMKDAQSPKIFDTRGVAKPQTFGAHSNAENEFRFLALARKMKSFLPEVVKGFASALDWAALEQEQIDSKRVNERFGSEQSPSGLRIPAALEQDLQLHALFM